MKQVSPFRLWRSRPSHQLKNLLHELGLSLPQKANLKVKKQRMWDIFKNNEIKSVRGNVTYCWCLHLKNLQELHRLSVISVKLLPLNKCKEKMHWRTSTKLQMQQGTTAVFWWISFLAGFKRGRWLTRNGLTPSLLFLLPKIWITRAKIQCRWIAMPKENLQKIFHLVWVISGVN